MTRWRFTVPLVVALCALAAGCASTVGGRGTLEAHGGSGSSSPGNGRHIALQRIPLRRGDLPSGWVAHKPKPDDPGSDAFDEQFASCVGAVGGTGAVSSAKGPDFDNGPAEISSSANRYASQQEIDKDVEILTSPRAESCLNSALHDMLVKTLRGKAQLGAVQLAITAGPNGGPANVAATATGTITLSRAGQSIQLFIDIAFITGPRIEADVEFFDVGAPVDPRLRQQLIQLVARRAARA
jgi:hypothetical protein